jgi:hypothetical protein
MKKANFFLSIPLKQFFENNFFFGPMDCEEKNPCGSSPHKYLSFGTIFDPPIDLLTTHC